MATYTPLHLAPWFHEEHVAPPPSFARLPPVSEYLHMWCRNPEQRERLEVLSNAIHRGGGPFELLEAGARGALEVDDYLEARLEGLEAREPPHLLRLRAAIGVYLSIFNSPGIELRRPLVCELLRLSRPFSAPPGVPSASVCAWPNSLFGTGKTTPDELRRREVWMAELAPLLVSSGVHVEGGDVDALPFVREACAMVTKRVPHTLTWCAHVMLSLGLSPLMQSSLPSSATALIRPPRLDWVNRYPANTPPAARRAQNAYLDACMILLAENFSAGTRADLSFVRARRVLDAVRMAAVLLGMDRENIDASAVMQMGVAAWFRSQGVATDPGRMDLTLRLVRLAADFAASVTNLMGAIARLCARAESPRTCYAEIYVLALAHISSAQTLRELSSRLASPASDVREFDASYDAWRGNLRAIALSGLFCARLPPPSISSDSASPGSGSGSPSSPHTQ